MDYHFWLPLLVNAAAVYLLYEQNKIQRRMARISTGAAQVADSPRAGFFVNNWPIAVMTLLMAISWLPYLLGQKGLPETNFQFTVNAPHLYPTSEGKQTPFSEGKPAAFNVYFTNQGPKGALDTDWRAMVTLLPGPASQRVEDDAWSEFERSVARLGPSRDLIPGVSSWHTFYSRELTATDITDIRSGRLLVYVMAEGVFRDGTGMHTVQMCQYVQAPGDVPIWPSCHGHMVVR